MIVKAVVIAWTAVFVLGVARPMESGYPLNWNRSFEVRGRSGSWRVQSLFSPADFGHSSQGVDLGFEFSTGNLTYTGKPARLRWYRMEVQLPEELSIRVRPGPPGRSSACAVDTRDGVSMEGNMTRPGANFNHGVCDVYPWRRSATELASTVTKGLYVVAWEDENGVHAEVLPLSQVRWQ